MSDDYKDEVIQGHDYDGIQELNNPLPKWWLFVFYACIVFAAGYYSYYEILGGPSSTQELQTDLDKINELKAKTEQDMGSPSEVDVPALLADMTVLEKGKAGYIQTCAACHGQNGEGLIGPNLADNYWLHSKGDYEGVLNAVLVGFPEKGMPGWKDLIPKDTHTPISIYVLSLKGSNPANPKAPQGELIE